MIGTNKLGKIELIWFIYFINFGTLRCRVLIGDDGELLRIMLCKKIVQYARCHNTRDGEPNLFAAMQSNVRWGTLGTL